MPWLIKAASFLLIMVVPTAGVVRFGRNLRVKAFSTEVDRGNNFQRTTIISESNAKVKFIKSLSLKKKRDSTDAVLLEGFRQIEDAFSYGIKPKYVFISERVIDSPLSRSLLEKFASRSAENFDIVSDKIMNSIAETVHSQGILAAFIKPSPLLEIPVSKDGGPVVILDCIADPGNLGTIIRSCFGFGVSSVIKLSGGCDIWSPKVLRASMGLGINPAMPILELESWEAVARYLADYSTRLHRVGLLPSAKDLQVLVADSEESDRSVSYEQVDFSRPTVIIVGSEAHGVSPQAMQVVDSVRTIRIPMTRKLDSFNAAVAASVILAEAARQRQQK